MKHTLLLFVLCSFGFLNGFSQSEKNDLKLTVAGLPLFGDADGFGSGLNGFVLKPSIGYYISNRTSIELNFSYGTMNNLTIGTVDSYYQSFAFTPTLRNNFVNQEKWRLFAEFGFGLGTIQYNADNNNFRNFQHDELSGGITILNIGLGGNYYFNEKFGIEFIIPYLTINNITSEQSNNLYSGIGPTIGLTYLLK